MRILSALMNTFSPVDRTRFEQLRGIIREHVAGYAIVGAALAEIRDRQLYRGAFDTFESFCLREYDWTPQHCNRLIKAAELARKLEPTGSAPRTERLARPIASLPDDDQVEAWTDVIALAAGTEPTADHVAAAVRKRRPGKTKKPRVAKPLRLKVPGGLVLLTPGRGFTDFAEMLRCAATKLDEQHRRAA